MDDSTVDDRRITHHNEKNTCPTDQKYSSGRRSGCVIDYCLWMTSQTEVQRLHCKIRTTS
uniref:Uncharacterized protein n=1 Tax=Anguilla anguilla TaxID=7936 RepID=A0A0E9UQG4_ANGAN